MRCSIALWFGHELQIHGWPCTQPYRTPQNSAIYHRAAHSHTVRWCVAGLCIGRIDFVDGDPYGRRTQPLHRRHNEPDGVWNHQPRDCLLNYLFRCRSKKTSKLRVTDLCPENSPGTGEFSVQKASNAENVSIWWRHHDTAVHRRAAG